MRTILLLVTLGACATDEPTGPCASASGTYDVTWVPRMGLCSEINLVVPVDFGPYESTDCVGERSQSVDGCTYEYDIACPGSATAAALDVRGLTRGNADASVLVGVDSMCFYDTSGALDCCDTFDVSWVRL